MLLTSLCYVQRGEEYLLLLRNKKAHDANQGKWIGVGGKFLDGESPEECMLRELQEETGLTATAWRFRGLVTFASDQWPTEYMHLFTVTGWQGQLRPCDEGDLAWHDRRRLAELPMWQGDRVFLDLLQAEAPFFSLKLRYAGEELAEAILDGKRL